MAPRTRKQAVQVEGSDRASRHRLATPRGSTAARRTQYGPGYRLPRTVLPVSYRLHVHVDPERSRVFSGTVEVDVHISSACEEIVLHAVDLDIDKATVGALGERGEPVRARTRLRSETLHLRRLKGPFAQGDLTLSMSFRGHLRDDLRGLYLASTNGQRFAVTQLEAADARRFFPCFDEPAFKATFSLNVTTGADHTVVSNSPVASCDKYTEDQNTHRFQPTPKLSTYLLALAVGPLEGSRVRRCGEIPIRVFYARGASGLARFALETAAASLTRLQRYFGIPYPYEKLDLVAVPDFEIGAMENAGAVFFRETLLLLDERSASLPERKRAAEVICHELAHMWFGNLVTMAWWDDLWLNEAFATWIAFAVVDAWQPGWRMWNDFAHGRNAALELDALASTHAIYTTVKTPDEATENFDLITYEKGAAVVRMLEHYLGKSCFRQGVRSYLREHREGNAVAADLWRHLQAAAGQRGIDRLVRSWIEQPGFPLLSMTRKNGPHGVHLELTQTRYRAGGPPRGAKAGTTDAKWLLPWTGRSVRGTLRADGHGRNRREIRHLLSRRRESLDLSGLRVGRHPILGNADQAGCYRVAYDSETLAALAGRLPSLLVSERLGLVSDGWALLHAGYLGLSDYFPLLRAFRTDTDPDVLSAVMLSLERIAAAAPTEQQHACRQLVRTDYAERLHKEMLARPDGDEQAVLHAVLFELIGKVGEDPAVKTWAAELCDRYLSDRRTLNGNLAAPVVAVAAIDGDASLLSRYREAARNDRTPQQRRRVRMALADFRDKKLAAQVQRLCLEPEIPTQDVALVLARQLENPAVGASTWAFIKRRFAALEKRLTPMLTGRLIAATTALGPEHQQDVLAFLKAHPLPTAQRAARQTIERLRLEKAFRRRLARQLPDAIALAQQSAGDSDP
ncbi:MAG: M1 family metallopeptidase [Myxococcales bacterium]|nr:M1 family metallopeptidase [Myxococcales bacterium]